MKTYFSLKSILNNYPPAPANPEIPSARDKLLADIAKTQHALEVAYCGFDYATDPDLIDCFKEISFPVESGTADGIVFRRGTNRKSSLYTRKPLFAS